MTTKKILQLQVSSGALCTPCQRHTQLDSQSQHETGPRLNLERRCGTRAIKTNVKPYSILKAATDWTIMMDTYEKQYKIPENIFASTSRPDIFMYSRILKRVVMIELAVPWETNIPKDHTIKVNKYYELTNELTRNKFVVDLYAVEVGVRGITAKSLYNLLKDLGLSRTHIN
nr:uncharacterized protein LOC116773960 [Danaus plexippus plexippus]